MIYSYGNGRPDRRPGPVECGRAARGAAHTRKTRAVCTMYTVCKIFFIFLVKNQVRSYGKVIIIVRVQRVEVII